MSKTKKELILESFQKMDWDMLDMVLDSDKTYQDATKDVFLEKVKGVFKVFKENGDTVLSAYKGRCSSCNCSNKGHKGYSFVGNKSNRHIDLIFEERNKDIEDICQCEIFSTEDTSVKRENSVCIDVKEDEKAGFKSSTNFLIESQKYKMAYEELMQHQDKIIGKEIYMPWLEKYAELYHSANVIIVRRFADSSNFYWLYYHINELGGFLKLSDTAEIAVKEFQTIDENNESQLLRWLVKYEETSRKLNVFLYIYYEGPYPEGCSYYKVNDVKIDRSDFRHIVKFKNLYDDYYWDRLKKYSTFSFEEEKQILKENGEKANYVYTLSYHLKKRGVKV